MMLNNIIYLTLIFVSTTTDGYRILFVIPTPSISHQLPFRPLTQELARRGHDVVVITTDPAFPKGETPENLTEVDVHDLTYEMVKLELLLENDGNIFNQMKLCHEYTTNIFEAQLQSEQVKNVIHDRNKTFDLLLVEEWWRPTLVMSYLIKNVPLISISSFGSIYGYYAKLGVPAHPILYPPIVSRLTYNLTLWEKLKHIYMCLRLQYTFESVEKSENEMLRRNFGPDVPNISELYRNVELYMLASHPLWGLNRPVPPNVIHIGGIHQKIKKDLPKDLEDFLNSSKNGVIYMSLGTNIIPSTLPRHIIRIFTKVLGEQPYDILWKYDKEELENKPNNTKISKWFPQSDLLYHPKIKLFITQGGLQSTDEAISAGVPLIGLPMIIDQWYNTNNYLRYGIGIKIDIDTIDEAKLRDGITKVTGDPSYRKNITKLRELMRDEPQSPLERAVWWIEHVARHGGARHLRAPAANMSWGEFLEIELLIFILVCIFLVIILVAAGLYYFIRLITAGRLVKVKKS